MSNAENKNTILSVAVWVVLVCPFFLRPDGFTWFFARNGPMAVFHASDTVLQILFVLLDGSYTTGLLTFCVLSALGSYRWSYRMAEYELTAMVLAVPEADIFQVQQQPTIMKKKQTRKRTSSKQLPVVENRPVVVAKPETPKLVEVESPITSQGVDKEEEEETKSALAEGSVETTSEPSTVEEEPAVEELLEAPEVEEEEEEENKFVVVEEDVAEVDVVDTEALMERFLLEEEKEDEMDEQRVDEECTWTVKKSRRSASNKKQQIQEGQKNIILSPRRQNNKTRKSAIEKISKSMLKQDTRRPASADLGNAISSNNQQEQANVVHGKTRKLVSRQAPLGSWRNGPSISAPTLPVFSVQNEHPVARQQQQQSQQQQNFKVPSTAAAAMAGGKNVIGTQHKMAPRSSSSLFRFLQNLQLEEYHDVFIAEKLDLQTLMMLSNRDIECLGLPLGPKKKIHIALRELSRKENGGQGVRIDSKRASSQPSVTTSTPIKHDDIPTAIPMQPSTHHTMSFSFHGGVPVHVQLPYHVNISTSTPGMAQYATPVYPAKNQRSEQEQLEFDMSLIANQMSSSVLDFD